MYGALSVWMSEAQAYCWLGLEAGKTPANLESEFLSVWLVWMYLNVCDRVYGNPGVWTSERMTMSVWLAWPGGERHGTPLGKNLATAPLSLHRRHYHAFVFVFVLQVISQQKSNCIFLNWCFNCARMDHLPRHPKLNHQTLQIYTGSFTWQYKHTTSQYLIWQQLKCCYFCTVSVGTAFIKTSQKTNKHHILLWTAYGMKPW